MSQDAEYLGTRRIRERQESAVVPAGASAARTDVHAASEPPPNASALEAAVLLVDDTLSNLLGLEAVLEPLGHRLVRAQSGEEAIARMLEQDFAVVLLDVQMPGLDGYETAARIKSQPRLSAVPLIFVTAIDRDASHVFRGYERGAVDFLHKPLDPIVLRSKVSVFVDLYLRGERVKAQAALLRGADRELADRRSRDRTLHVMEAMPNPLWATTDDGTVEYANRAWREYSGYASEELVGFTDARVVHPEDRPLLATAWLAAVHDGRELDTECRLRRNSDGTYRWHLLRARPEKLDGDRLDAWIVSATDVDESKRAEEIRADLLRREKAARREAEEASRAKDEFVATVSHELRAPLHAILGWVELLQSGSIDEAEAERALRTIDRNARAQAALVDELLNVSRVLAGKFDLEMRTTDLASLARAVIETFGPQAESKGIALHLELSPGAHESISVDPQRIEQVLRNLVSNAVKFTADGGAVRLRVGVEGREAVVRVMDTGIGMTAEFLRVAFDRFSQADGSIRRSRGGLGLGLFIARHLIALHGGTLTGESEGPSRGSTFVARFPARRPERRDESALGTAPEASDARRVTRLRGAASERPLRDVVVLVVDDDPDARDLLGMALERSGASVAFASDADEAVEAVIAQRPDVVISDIGLPHEDGYAMLERIRALGMERGGFAPAIAVSGYAHAKDRSHAFAAGFQAHLAKPVELAELVALVARIATRLKPRA